MNNKINNKLYLYNINIILINKELKNNNYYFKNIMEGIEKGHTFSIDPLERIKEIKKEIKELKELKKLIKILIKQQERKEAKNEL